jgi:hypothetical protein
MRDFTANHFSLGREEGKETCPVEFIKRELSLARALIIKSPLESFNRINVREYI